MHIGRRFEWDSEKAALNLAKHGISFEAALSIFDGHEHLVAAKHGDDGEIRLMALGELQGVVIIAVVFTDRSGVTRIISARPASKKERQLYHESR